MVLQYNLQVLKLAHCPCMSLRHLTRLSLLFLQKLIQQTVRVEAAAFQTMAFRSSFHSTYLHNIQTWVRLRPQFGLRRLNGLDQESHEASATFVRPRQ